MSHRTLKEFLNAVSNIEGVTTLIFEDMSLAYINSDMLNDIYSYCNFSVHFSKKCCPENKLYIPLQILETQAMPSTYLREAHKKYEYFATTFNNEDIIVKERTKKLLVVQKAKPTYKGALTVTQKISAYLRKCKALPDGVELEKLLK